MAARLEGRWVDSCALDIADDGGISEEEIATIVGIDRKRLVALSAEAACHLRKRIRTYFTENDLW